MTAQGSLHAGKAWPSVQPHVRCMACPTRSLVGVPRRGLQAPCQTRSTHGAASLPFPAQAAAGAAASCSRAPSPHGAAGCAGRQPSFSRMQAAPGMQCDQMPLVDSETRICMAAQPRHARAVHGPLPTMGVQPPAWGQGPTCAWASAFEQTCAPRFMPPPVRQGPPTFFILSVRHVLLICARTGALQGVNRGPFVKPSWAESTAVEVSAMVLHMSGCITGAGSHRALGLTNSMHAGHARAFLARPACRPLGPLGRRPVHVRSHSGAVPSHGGVPPGGSGGSSGFGRGGDDGSSGDDGRDPTATAALLLAGKASTAGLPAGAHVWVGGGGAMPLAVPGPWAACRGGAGTGDCAWPA